jgi:O-antigen ligase
MKIAQILLFLMPSGLVFALHKWTVLGYPVYFLEGVFTLFILFTFRETIKKISRNVWLSLDKMMVVGLVLFLVGATLSTLLNEVSTTSLGQFKSWFIFPAIFFVYTYSYLFLKDGTSKTLYVSWLTGVSVIASIALYGYANNLLTYDQRLAFPYTSANFLAYVLAPAIIVCGYFIFQLRDNKKRLLLGPLLTTIIFLTFLTKSYNTWLAITAAAAVGLYFVGIQKSQLVKRRRLIVGIAILFLMSSFLFLELGSPKFQNLFLENGRSSFDSRMMIWDSAEAIIKDHWVLGIGVGNFQDNYLLYQTNFAPYLEWAVPQPHNIVLAVWLQTGVVGLIGFVVFLGRCLQLLSVKCYREREIKKRLEGAAIISLWVLFLGYGTLDTPYFRNDLAFVFWLQVLLSCLYLRKK